MNGDLDKLSLKSHHVEVITYQCQNPNAGLANLCLFDYK